MTLKVLVMTSLLPLAACSMFQRSPGSGYSHQESSSNQRPSSPSLRHENLDMQRRAAEMGYSPDEALTPEQQEQIEERRRLRALESRLESHREREQYSKILPWLNTDQEKIEFLSIGTLEGRQAWINSRNIWKRSQEPTEGVKGIIESGDIAVGMQMEYVKKAWGEPQTIEVSGHPSFKNEQWKYVRFVATPDGYRQEKRLVYFEGGRVVGWETKN